MAACGRFDRDDDGPEGRRVSRAGGARRREPQPPDGRSHADLARLRQGRVDAAVILIAAQVFPRTPEGGAFARAEAAEKLAAIPALIRDSRDHAALATTADDVRRLAAQGRLGALLGFQNAHAGVIEHAGLSDLGRQAEQPRRIDRRVFR